MVKTTQKIGLGDQSILEFLLGDFERQAAGQVGLAVFFAYFYFENAGHTATTPKPAYDAVGADDAAELDMIQFRVQLPLPCVLACDDQVILVGSVHHPDFGRIVSVEDPVSLQMVGLVEVAVGLQVVCRA